MTTTEKVGLVLLLLGTIAAIIALGLYGGAL